MRRFHLTAAGAMTLWMLGAATAVGGQPRPIFTTHFFDWYRVTAEQPYPRHQRVWTYRPLWEQFGIRSEEIGNTENYYAAQMRLIRQAGFDGIHYEWFGQQPSDACIAALRATKMPVAMFYDQEIRFNQYPAYIKPTDEFVRTLVQDVGSFYDRIPPSLWLREADGTLPLIFYAYRFDTSFRQVDVWDRFYRNLLAGLERRLSSRVRIYWTDAGQMPQLYAFQHFPAIHAYTFTWWGSQRQVNARSVTLVAGYDDAGAVVGGRAARTVANDPQILEADYTLARWSSPRLVFNYGWNEFFEGENILPDDAWRDWRLRALSAIVRGLKTERRASRLPSALLLADDLFPASLRQPNPLYEGASALLGAFRYLFPQAHHALGGKADSALLKRYAIVLALDRDRTPEQESRLLRLAKSGKTRVVIYAPEAARPNGVVAQFAAGPVRLAVQGVPIPPANQWVGVVRNLDLDPARFPLFHIRVRNSPNTFYHVRFIGVDAEGKTYENHDNQSPYDWQATGDGWVERTENAKQILEAYAGKPIVRITGLVLILNAQGISGRYRADFTDAYFTDLDRSAKERVNLAAREGWQYRASFQNDPTGQLSQGGFQALAEQDGTLRLTLRALQPTDLPVDASTLDFPIRSGVRVLAWTEWRNRRIPLVLQKGNLFWVNTMSPVPKVYRALLPALGMPPVREAVHTQFTVVRGKATRYQLRTSTSLLRSEIPLDWVRMLHRADVSAPVTYSYPATSRPLALVRTRAGEARPVPMTTRVSREGRCEAPGQITLQPGDTADFYRLPLRVRPLGSATVLVEVTGYSAKGADIQLRGRGAVSLRALRSGLTITLGGRPAPARIKIPSRVKVSGRLEWHSNVE